MNLFSKILLNIIDENVLVFMGLNSTFFDSKDHPDKWSGKEIMGHLIDSAHHNHRRFTLAAIQDHLIFDGYDQEAWVKLNGYQSRELSELIDVWYHHNVHLVRLIENISEELLHSSTRKHNFHEITMNRIDAEESSTLSYLIWDYIYHLEHHLNQLSDKYNRKLPTFDQIKISDDIISSKE